MSKAVVQESFGGPEVLEVREVEEPHAGPGQLRVRVAAAGLNPVDWIVASSQQAAQAFGVTLPAGFGNDFAGTVDEVGEGVEAFAVGDRVYGGARGRAVAEFVVVTPDEVEHTPDGVDDVTASTLQIAGRTAVAALDAIGASAGGAASAEFLRSLGAEPVEYGDGLADRVRALAPDGITAATDLFGTEAATVALELGVAPERISTIAAHDPDLTVKAVGGRDAAPDALERVTALITAGKLTVPIAARFPIDQIRDAVALQQSRHVKGKVVVVID